MTGRRAGKALAVLLTLALAAVLLHRTFRAYDAAEIIASIMSISPARLAAVGAFAAASYLCLTGFDALGVRYAGAALPYRRVAMASMISLSIGHTIGFAALSSGAVRYRFYSRFGLTLEQFAKVILLCAATVGIGLATLLSLGLLARPEIAERIGGLTPEIVLALGAVCGALPVAYLILAAVAPGGIRLGSWMLEMPPLPIAFGQLVIGPLNFAMVVACLHTAISAGSSIDYLDVLAAYTVANAVSLVTHVPGGLGVIEAVVAFLLPGADVIGALIVFRAVYFIVPFVLGTTALAVIELRQPRRPVDQEGTIGAGLARLRR